MGTTDFLKKIINPLFIIWEEKNCQKMSSSRNVLSVDPILSLNYIFQVFINNIR